MCGKWPRRNWEREESSFRAAIFSLARFRTRKKRLSHIKCSVQSKLATDLKYDVDVIMLSLQRVNTRTSDDMREALFGCFRGKYLGTLFVEIKHRHERNVG